MKLSKGAKIYTMDGQEIGRLSRFVLDPKTKNVTDLVFERGLLTNTEYVVPMHVVDHVDESGIHLGQLPVDDPKDLPNFLEEEFVATDEHALIEQGGINADEVNSYYYNPPSSLGAGNVFTPNDLRVNLPPGIGPVNTPSGIPVSGEPPIIKETMQNIPKGTVSVKEGSKVYSSDGKHIGNVERMFVDSNNGEVTHIVISKGVLLKERKQIPVDWISDVQEDEIHLAVDQGVVERLPGFQE